jgi:UDP-4-amino-4,6-dideoxy-N-acetyl-beta-L-altrosamine transaminase
MTTRVAAPPLPYGRQSVDEADIAAVAAAMRSDHLTTGPFVDRFEAELAARTGGAPVVAVSSGTAALHAAYAAAGLGRGAELVTTPLTFAATATAALHLGATVRFADVEDDTLCLDPAAAQDAMTTRTRVVTAVDYAGHPADHSRLRRVAHTCGALLVDDAAHAIGSVLDGRPIGSHADLTTFSFHPVKTITTGEGGAVAVGRTDLVDAVRRFRSHGMVREPELLQLVDEGAWHQEVHDLGLNYRMPDILAALGCSQLRKLGRFVARRAEIAARYQRLLADVDGLRLPTIRPGAEPAWHLYAVRVADGRRREVFDQLRAGGIGVQVHYLPVHLHPLFARMGYRAGACPVAERAYRELISLPLHPSMSDTDVDRVVDELQRILG